MLRQMEAEEDPIIEVTRAVAAILREWLLATDRENPLPRQKAISAAAEMIAKDVGRAAPGAAVTVVAELRSNPGSYLPLDASNRGEVEAMLTRLGDEVSVRLASDRGLLR